MGFFEEFKTFAMRGNVVDLAVGFTVGAAFSTVASSLVDDIIMPPLGLLIGQNRFVNMFTVLESGDPELARRPYETLEQAQAAGAVTLNYGLFLNNIVTFLLIALAMFLLIRLINRIDAEHRAVDDNLPGAEQLHIHRHTQRPTDKPRNFLSTPVGAQSFSPSLCRAPRQHAIFGRYPTSRFLLLFHPARNILVHGSVAQDVRVAEAAKNRSLSPLIKMEVKSDRP